MPGEAKIDGIDLLPLLTGETNQLARGTVFWQLDLYRNLQRHYAKPKPYATEIARRGRWKMLARDGVPVELFDIETDLEEKQNLLDQEPEVVESLSVELARWLSQPRQPFGKMDRPAPNKTDARNGL